MNYTDWVGGIGVGLILIAYFLGLFKLISSEGYAYLFMNLIGASLACFASISINYWPFMILEGAWALVSFAGIVRKSVKISGQ